MSATASKVERVFTDFVEDNYRMAYSVALRIVRNAADAEDAVQDAFLQAYRAFDRFQGRSKETTWLYRLVTNSALMKIRKESRHLRHNAGIAAEDVQVADNAPGPEQEAEANEVLGFVEQALGHLAPDLRTAVVLRDVEGFSTDEAAEIVGVSRPAFKARLHRGRLELRQILLPQLAVQA